MGTLHPHLVASSPLRLLPDVAIRTAGRPTSHVSRCYRLLPARAREWRRSRRAIDSSPHTVRLRRRLPRRRRRYHIVAIPDHTVHTHLCATHTLTPPSSRRSSSPSCAPSTRCYKAYDLPPLRLGNPAYRGHSILVALLIFNPHHETNDVRNISGGRIVYSLPIATWRSATLFLSFVFGEVDGLRPAIHQRLHPTRPIPMRLSAADATTRSPPSFRRALVPLHCAIRSLLAGTAPPSS
ncbi:hypothetical protein B0H13DRAFT_2365967 [Mycena leptocephala]|nr:hypothetical protein B0H13DRAFT_2365967 [Mycena leptocephala]